MNLQRDVTIIIITNRLQQLLHLTIESYISIEEISCSVVEHNNLRALIQTLPEILQEESNNSDKNLANSHQSY